MKCDVLVLNLCKILNKTTIKKITAKNYLKEMTYEIY